MDNFLATIIMFGGNFAPFSWAFCNGQIMSISANSALYSLIGTFYGGDGMTTFGLPDLRGRTPIHQGQGPGLSPYILGQVGGIESTTLMPNNMPIHTHTITNNLVVTPSAANTAATTNTPSATVAPAVLPKIGTGPAAVTVNGYATPVAGVTLAPDTVTGTITAATAGGSQSFNIQNPYLAVSFCIALQGVFPSRN